MRSSIAPCPEDLQPTAAHMGRISYTDRLLDVLQHAPIGTMVFCPGSAPAPFPLSVHWVDPDSQKRWRVAPWQAWKGHDPHEIEEPIRRLLARLRRVSIDTCPLPPSLGGAARMLLTAWRDRHAAIWPRLPADVLPSLRWGCRGGMQRTYSTFCPDATYLDITAAYRWVHEQGIPSGPIDRSTRRDAACTTTAQVLDRIRIQHERGRGGILTVPLVLHGQAQFDPTFSRIQDWHHNRYHLGGCLWMGPSCELEAILESGAGEVIPSYLFNGVWWEGIHGAWFTLSRRAGELFVQLQAELPPALYKSVYKALWPHWDAVGGWTGEILARPPWVPDGTQELIAEDGFPLIAQRERPLDGYEWQPDPRIPDLYWRRHEPPTTGDELFRPDVVAWITGRIRAEILRRLHWKPVMAMVDALVVPEETRHLWEPTIHRDELQPGDWRPECRGVYLGVSPGQYWIGGAAAELAERDAYRLKLSGFPNGGQALASLRRAAWKAAHTHREQRRGVVRMVELQLEGEWEGVIDASDRQFQWPAFEPR